MMKPEQFRKLIGELQKYIAGGSNDVLKSLTFNRPSQYYVKVGDQQRIIGKLKAHYEIVNRNDGLTVELHFEDNETNDLFHKTMQSLPKELEWFKWYKSKSIRHKNKISHDSKNIHEELCDQLLFLEKNLGDQAREIIQNPSKKGSSLVNNYKHLNQILYGPPGTGKTYNSIKEAISIIEPGFKLDQPWHLIKKKYDELVKKNQIIFTTFHQSMSYEDFVEGIKPQEPKDDGVAVSYAVEDGIFKQICKRANPITGNFEEVIEKFKKDISESDGQPPKTIVGKGTTFDVKFKDTLVFYVHPHASSKKEEAWYPVNISNIEKVFITGETEKVYNPTYVREILSYLKKEYGLVEGSPLAKEKEKYVLIIDEINRGNISAIFGELITLLEPAKRLDGDEALEIKLPYSKKLFGVPDNLYIIGTMNTADRSVEALDTALRRRFTFTEMPPDPDLIKEAGNKISKIELSGFTVDLVELLNIINQRIEVLLDKDHLIGHSYFMKVTDVDSLQQAFSKEIIPLLREYFFGDYGKVSLVLGEGFCKGEKAGESKGNDVFAHVSDYDASVFMDKLIYTINDPLKMTDSVFRDAIKTLLREPVDEN